jgi:hypothetical protein
MPIHDWTRVRANRFHDFHQSWTIAIRDVLNAGLLPPGYFAIAEQITGGLEADVIALELTPPAGTAASTALAVEVESPKARFVVRSEAAKYARKANRITVRHPDGDVVAVIEIVSPGNKDSRHAVAAFARKAVELLHAGIHLLIVDLFPPNRRNPQGIHKLIWDRIRDEPFELPPDKRLTLAAYASGSEIVAYVEPVAVGDVLRDMPVFLTASHHVACPLEATYQAAWSVYPAPLKGPLERPAASADKK